MYKLTTPTFTFKFPDCFDTSQLSPENTYVTFSHKNAKEIEKTLKSKYNRKRSGNKRTLSRSVFDPGRNRIISLWRDKSTNKLGI